MDLDKSFGTDLNEKSTIKFQSKMNPRKQIDIVEVKGKHFDDEMTSNNQTADMNFSANRTYSSISSASSELTTKSNYVTAYTSNNTINTSLISDKTADLSNATNKSSFITTPSDVVTLSSNDCILNTNDINETSSFITNVADNIATTPSRRRSTRIMNKTPSKLDDNESNELLSCSMLFNLMDNTGEKLNKKLDNDLLYDELNEKCKLEKSSKIKIPRLKFRKNLAKKNGKLLKINHRFGQSKIAKKTLNDRLKRLNKESKLKWLVKRCNDKKNEQLPIIEDDVKIVKVVNEVINIDDDTDDDDDDEPLCSLIKTVNNVDTEKRDSIKEIKIDFVESIITDVNNKKRDRLTAISPPSTPVITESKTDVTLTDVQISVQKSGTPTMSILKKKSRLNMSCSAASSEFSLLGNLESSANKRRVSFCDAVRIEEIEPNSNKSMINRAAIKAAQNKAKLVLFNNKMSAAVSSPMSNGSNGSNTSLSQGSNISNNNNTNNNTESKLNGSINSNLNQSINKVN